MAAPVLEKRLVGAHVTGRVVDAERQTEGWRVVLDHLRIETRNGALIPEATPEKVRIRLDKRAEAAPGEWISLRATLSPPPEPAAPGGFDFARQAWFQGLGAVGFSFGRVEHLPVPQDSALRTERWGNGFFLWLSESRQNLTKRIVAAIGGAEGAVAAALITGDQGAIPKDLMAAYRDSGLAHLLSISGLHMSMLAGLVFFAVRGFLAGIEPVALRYPIKKWTALIALGATFFYLLISGASVPTQRSFLMIAVVLVAILVDRTALSMRSIAWAAALILLLEPESLLGASFQMSFAAVTALIAVYESNQRRFAQWRAEGEPAWWKGFALYVGGVALTTLIASSATTPFALYHFNRFAPYSLIANMLAVPVTGVLVMPFALAAFALMPFGLEALALIPMGWGVWVVDRIAYETASWPGAGIAVPSFAAWGLAAAVTGGLWLCLWRAKWRHWGWLGLPVFFAALFMAQPPDILVNADASLLAVRAKGGLLFSTEKGGQNFLRETWQRRNADGQAGRFPAPGESSGDLACDGEGCVLTRSGRKIAIAWQASALLEDCRSADFIISAVPIRNACGKEPPASIDRFSVWREGGHALWLENDGTIRVETVRALRGDRPWSLTAATKKQMAWAASRKPSTQTPPQDLEGAGQAEQTSGDATKENEGDEAENEETAAPPDIPAGEP